jgi:hemerythrin-like metal-binding protein
MKEFIETQYEGTNWDERFELGIPLIDRQHRNLVRITDNLHFTCSRSSETANFRFIQAARELIDYIHYHFNTEEKLMVLFEFPGWLKHKKEHEDFCQEILSLSKQFDDEEHFVPSQFVHFLKKWIMYHIEVSDRVFTDFFQNMKHHDKLKLALAG